MTEEETLLLLRFVKAACPQQKIDKYTPEAWYELLGDLAPGDCEAAAAAVAKRQPFIAPAEIRAEVKRLRERRLDAVPLPAPPAEVADQPGRYRQVLQARVKRIADGLALAPAIEGAPRDGDPPEDYLAARKALPEPEPPKPDYEALAREQAAESRREREGRAR